MCWHLALGGSLVKLSVGQSASQTPQLRVLWVLVGGKVTPKHAQGHGHLNPRTQKPVPVLECRGIRISDHQLARWWDVIWTRLTGGLV